jgi:hypothetical protein
LSQQTLETHCPERHIAAPVQVAPGSCCGEQPPFWGKKPAEHPLHVPATHRWPLSQVTPMHLGSMQLPFQQTWLSEQVAAPHSGE